MTQISNRIKILVVLMFLFSVFPFFNISHAQTPTPPEQIRQYVPLAPLPGTTVNGSNRADLGSYIPGLFSLIIGLATVLAVARIIWGGVLYITTDAIQGKSQGKEMIIESIWGLVLISTCWLILYTINPRLTNLNLNIQPSVIPAGPAASATSPSVGACQNCQTLVGFTIVNTGSQIDSRILAPLTQLNSDMRNAGLNLTITEAYPPTGTTHVPGSCHNTGTCVDARINNTTPQNLIQVINSAQRNGLLAVFEVTNQNDFNNLTDSRYCRAVCLPASSVMLNTRATGAHFHIVRAGGS